jgi:thioredoxin 1
MKPLQKMMILVALLVAVGLVLAKRQQNAKSEPASTTASVTAEKPLPRLVDLGAGKCIPCKAMAPILEELRKEYAGVFEVVFIDVWEDPPAAEPYNINLIPTQIFFDAEGKELWRHEGFLAKADILAKWKELGLEL